MLFGCDISRWNTETPVGLGFYFLKATEGRTWKDPLMQFHLENIKRNCGDNLPIIGFYHFARPSNNTPEMEADFFLEEIKDHIGKCLIALDWEDLHWVTRASYTEQVVWIHNFMELVNLRTGSNCILYCARYLLSNLLKAKLYTDTPLWLADYNKTETFINNQVCTPFGVSIAFRQFASYPIDLNYTNLSLEEIIKLITDD